MIRIDEMAHQPGTGSIRNIYFEQDTIQDGDTIPHIYLQIENDYKKWYIPKDLPTDIVKLLEYFENSENVTEQVLQDLWNWLKSTSTVVPFIEMYKYIAFIWMLQFDETTSEFKEI